MGERLEASPLSPVWKLHPPDLVGGRLGAPTLRPMWKLRPPDLVGEMLEAPPLIPTWNLHPPEFGGSLAEGASAKIIPKNSSHNGIFYSGNVSRGLFSSYGKAPGSSLVKTT